MQYPTMNDLRDKVDWEGGLYGALNYGIHPDDVPKSIRPWWIEAVRAAKVLEECENRLWDSNQD